MSLSGTVVSTYNNAGGNFGFGTPGGHLLKAPTEYGSASDQENLPYPMYNEPLGVFTLLERPKVIKSNVLEGNTSNFTYFDNRDSDCDLHLRMYLTQKKKRYGFKLDPSSVIKYVFNPAANVNIAKTNIKAAWVVEYHPGTNVPDVIFNPVNVVEGRTLAPRSDNSWASVSDKVSLSYSKSGTFVYTSPFVEKDLINSIIPEFTTTFYTGKEEHAQRNTYDFLGSHSCSSKDPVNTIWDESNGYSDGYFEVFLKYIVEVESNDIGRDGNPNKAIYILKYPVEMLNSASSANFYDSNIPYDLTLTGTNNTNYYTFIEALHNIYITGSISSTGLTGTNSNTLYFIAPNLLEVSSEATITGDVQFIADGSIVATTSNTPYSGDLKTWCAQKRGITAPLARIGDEEPEAGNNIAEQIMVNKGLEIFPNPTATGATVRYYLPANADVNLYISDLYGNKIDNLYTNSTQVAGIYSAQLNTYSLAAGTYLCTLEQNGQKSVQRLVVVK